MALCGLGSRPSANASPRPSRERSVVNCPPPAAAAAFPGPNAAYMSCAVAAFRQEVRWVPWAHPPGVVLHPGAALRRDSPVGAIAAVRLLLGPPSARGFLAAMDAWRVEKQIRGATDAAAVPGAGRLCVAAESIALPSSPVHVDVTTRPRPTLTSRPRPRPLSTSRHSTYATLRHGRSRVVGGSWSWSWSCRGLDVLRIRA